MFYAKKNNFIYHSTSPILILSESGLIFLFASLFVSVKSRMVNILGGVGHMVSVTTSGLCCCYSTKAARDNM